MIGAQKRKESRPRNDVGDRNLIVGAVLSISIVEEDEVAVFVEEFGRFGDDAGVVEGRPGLAVLEQFQ